MFIGIFFFKWRREEKYLGRYKNADKKQVGQCETAVEEGWSEEDGKMEVRRKKLQKSVRNIEKFTEMEQRVVDEQKERWQQELQDQKRNDLLLEHQRMKKRSHTLQSLQDTKEAVPKGRNNAMETWSESEMRLQKDKHGSKNWFKNPKVAEAELDEEIRNLRAGEERRGS